jgi:hypothetical protein
MKTYKVPFAAAIALTLLTLTWTALLAAPTKPGNELKQELGNAPIPPRLIVKAHSDAWNNYYFDRNAATELPIYFENVSRGELRGGLAGYRSLPAKPIAPRPNLKAHSDAWNAYYFDRNVNARLAPKATEYLQPGLRRGGLAK